MRKRVLALLACLVVASGCADRYLVREDALADLERTPERERRTSRLAAERLEDHRAVLVRGEAVAGALGPSSEPGKVIVRVRKTGFLPGLIVMGAGALVAAVGAGVAFAGPGDLEHARQQVAGVAIGGIGGLTLAVGASLTLIAAFGRKAELE